MMIMPSNDSGSYVHYLAGKYPGRIGWLISPKSWKNPPIYMKYALDNGCFVEWDEQAFVRMLYKTIGRHPPLWTVVPDVVGDAEETMKRWNEWNGFVSKLSPLAFACQDGVEPQDVPRNARCCFVGGTTEWKLKNAHKFKGICELLHIGRVNSSGRLRWAEEIGADSIDGTAFFRSGPSMALIEYFEGKRNGDLFEEEG